jgi:hypothetical protein
LLPLLLLKSRVLQKRGCRNMKFLMLENDLKGLLKGDTKLVFLFQHPVEGRIFSTDVNPLVDVLLDYPPEYDNDDDDEVA